MPAYYRVDVVVGAHSWVIEHADPPEYGPVTVRLGWKLAETDLPPDHPAPAWAQLELIALNAEDLADIDTGQPVAIRVHLTPAPEDPADTPVSFYGRVSVATAVPHGLGMVYRVTCDDYLADLSDQLVGDTAWPNTDPQRTRLARILKDGDTGAYRHEYPADMSTSNGHTGPRAAKLAIAAGLLARMVKQFYTRPVGAAANVQDPDAAHRLVVIHPYASDTGPGRPDGTLWAVDWRHTDNPSPLPGVAVIVAGKLTITVPADPARGVIDGAYCRTSAATWTRTQGTRTNTILFKWYDDITASTVEEILRPFYRVLPRQFVATLDTDLASSLTAGAREVYLADDEISGWACDKFEHLTYADPALLPQMWPNPANHAPAGAAGRSEFYTRPIVITPIADRHNPNYTGPDTGLIAGQLTGAELTIRRGRLETTFSLNQRIPRPAIPTAHTAGTDYFTIDDFAAFGVTINDLDPAVTLTQYRLVRSP